jgi:hypothetical protein
MVTSARRYIRPESQKYLSPVSMSFAVKVERYKVARSYAYRRLMPVLERGWILSDTA